MKQTLDIEAVRLFTLVADLKSFSRAGDSLALSQSAVSLKIKRLEEQLGRRLFERTPRSVRLTADGDGFLGAAHDLLAAHAAALAAFDLETFRLTVGISHHIVGADLPALLKKTTGAHPGLVLDVRLAASRDVLADFNDGHLDAAIILSFDRGPVDGVHQIEEPIGWMAAPEITLRDGQALPLVSQSGACSLRSKALNALDAASIPWVDAFIGGGLTTIGAAIAAGLGVAVLSRRAAPPGCIDVGQRLGLPDLPTPAIEVLSNVQGSRAKTAIGTLVAAMRTTTGGASVAS